MRASGKKTLIAAIVLALAVIHPGPAFAANAQDSSVQAADVSTSGLPVALKGETEIEQLTDVYEKARAEADMAEARVAELQARIDELEAVLPEQQARSDAGIRQRYIMQSKPLAVLEPLLSAQSLDDFLRQVDYLEIVSRANLEEFNKTCEMKAQVDQAKEEQERVREEADERAGEALAALSAAQDERAAAQKDAQENARSQAEKLGGEKSVGKAADGGEQPKDYREAATTDTEALSDGADWHADRDVFIEEWGSRIDAYLAGSPLAGQGVNFAASAWKWGIDPRWSPAISNTESSKGAYCIRPHNAWGWGAADSDPYGLASEWGSWEEAIDAHVAGLAKGYGYTITMRGAQSYCPNTWQSWYNKTLAQMAQI